jgi:sec-independent protein translocase protein TatC
MSFLDRLFRLREEPDQVKPFLQHLEDLRWTLVKMAVALISFMMGSFLFRHELVRIVQEPLRRVDPSLVSSLQTLGVADSMTISFQLAFYAGLVLSFPLLLFFLAQFILPALTRKEKKYVFPAIGIGFGLFLLGVCFSYFWVLPQALKFFKQDAESMGWTPNWRVREYYSFVTQMTLALGMAFELPVAVLVAVYLGFISYDLLSRTRPYAYVLVLLLAAVIAPSPDIMTFLSMGVPMCILYEGCIWIAWFIDKRRKARLELPLD